mgnify:CR=1 FL=1
MEWVRVAWCGIVWKMWNVVWKISTLNEQSLFFSFWIYPNRTRSVPSPYQVRVYGYGDSMEILRRGYGGDTESLRRRYEEATVNTCGCVSFHLRQWRLTLPQALAVATASVFLFLYLLDLVFLAGCNDEVISLYHTTSTYCIEFFCLHLRVVLPGSCYFLFAAVLR